MKNLRNKALLGIFSASITILSFIGHAENAHINNHLTEFTGNIESYSHQNVIQPIYFDSGKAIIKNDEFDKLENFINQNANNGSLRVVFVGHTDNQKLSNQSKSVHKDNYVLSKNRAETVMNKFQEHLGKRSNVALNYLGMGENSPVASNQTSTGMSLNRRVEVHFIYDTKKDMQASLVTIDRLSKNSSRYISSNDTSEVVYSSDAKLVKTGELAKLENIAAKSCATGCENLETIDGPTVVENNLATGTIDQIIDYTNNAASISPDLPVRNEAETNHELTSVKKKQYSVKPISEKLKEQKGASNISQASDADIGVAIENQNSKPAAEKSISVHFRKHWSCSRQSINA